ncbi:helix-turn-helix transcriptional regulator [Streptococcus sp. 121]|uniref:helix-turn-helix transcriptional regulator n=1 Tax=Streptococcus sp. 121 TaxID=2797637 RepID=UPI001F3CA6D3|nr:helix-turn-helix transcriptional regulator [Streptococcus sp. 121]
MQWTLKMLRVKENLSQKQAGDIFSVSPETWSNWERGKTTPDVKTAYKIAEHFNVSLDDIIFLDTFAV